MAKPGKKAAKKKASEAKPAKKADLRDLETKKADLKGGQRAYVDSGL